ncbi:hypothetical protein [uncultured Fibrobacter sp.]|uniref:hypothetical protein n=1 Tax=uncultured Fibrobacter sp. TaxID=261512 RepID=UPI0026085D9D|nr:hypothetical protein [uncultured Fibrobacter sp.]
MGYRLLTCLLVLALSLVGCANSYHWSKRHPAYTQPPYGELAITGLEKAFVLTRTKWFANRLGYGDSTQVKATAFCANAMKAEFQSLYSKLTVLPDSSLAKSPEESLKLDERIFIKGILPEQGISITAPDGKIPPQILLVHEVIIGTDLKRENFFDYALIHNESEEKREVQNISAIVSYTLWDNIRQRPLFSAVDEIQHPVRTLTEQDMQQLMHLTVQQIRKNLYQGAGR